MPRIQNQIRRRIDSSGQPHKIEQLCLDGIEIKTITPNIKSLLESCFSLQYLTMNDCQLRTLQNFPRLKNLIGLELSDNMISGEDLLKLSQCPSINFLTLDNNKISSITSLNHLKKLPQLQILQVHNNDLCDQGDYRQNIFEMFPKISIVDCYDRDGFQVEQDNASDYISNIENSRLDLLDLLDDQDLQEGDLPRTAIEYPYEGKFIQRSDSIKTSPSPIPGQNCAKIFPSPIIFQQRRETQRTEFLYDSDSEEESNLIKEFKRKFNKKQ